MIFDLIRLGWPNIAAILALAMMPILALTMAPDRRAAAVPTEPIESAAICLTPAECAVAATAAAPETILQ